MEIITSASNALVKRIVKLGQKKYREETGEFIVEGYRNVSDTVGFAPQSVRAVVLSESAYNAHGAEFSGMPITVVSDGIMQKISSTDSTQGVMSVNVQKHPQPPTSERCILLDRVRDPGNVGTVLRTALAAGYDVVLNNCADLYSPKVIRSAMSAVIKCRVALDLELAELKSYGYEMIAADMNGDSVFDVDAPRGRYCIVIGNEADGISGDVRTECDRVLSIPQNGIESLNAAVAAGIMMYALKYGK